MSGPHTQHNVTTTITSFVHYHFHYVITAKDTQYITEPFTPKGNAKGY